MEISFSLLKIIALSYLPFFLIGALIPNLKWLSIYSFLAAVATAFVFYDIYRVPETERFDGPGTIIGLMIVLLVGWGVYAGLITRGITIALQRYIQWRYLRIFLTLIGFLSLPAYYLAGQFLA